MNRTWMKRPGPRGRADISRDAKRGRRLSMLGALVLSGSMGLTVAACSGGPTASEIAEPTSLAFTEEGGVIESLGETIELNVRVFDQNGNEIPGVLLNWSSDSPDVLESLGGGAFRSVSNGEAVVRVRLAESFSEEHTNTGLLEAITTVVVDQRPVSLAVGLHGDTGGAPPLDRVILWSIGQKVRVQAWSVDARGQPTPDTPGPVVWQSDAESISAMDPDGTVTAIADGNTLLRVSGAGLDGELPLEVRAEWVVEVCVEFTDSPADGSGEQMDSCGTVGLTSTER